MGGGARISFTNCRFVCKIQKIKPHFSMEWAEKKASENAFIFFEEMNVKYWAEASSSSRV